MCDNPTKIIVAVGSNMPTDKLQRVQNALEFLESILTDYISSGPYETAPEAPSTHTYINAVVCASTSLSEQKLAELFKEYERQCGRTSASKQSDRIEIDVDVVCYGNRIVRRKEFESSYFKLGLQKISQR